MSGADIAYLCPRAAMFCVKDAVGANEPNDIAVDRKHFDAALGLLTAAHATDVAPESLRLAPRSARCWVGWTGAPLRGQQKSGSVR
jgi:hypothetical protein